MVDKVGVVAIEKTCKLLLACENAVTAGCRTDALLSERSSEHQELRLVASIVCDYLFPPSLTKAPLIYRLQEVPNRVECSVAEGVSRGGGVTLGRMVSHFDEIDATVIAEGYAADRSDKEQDAIEEQVRPFA